MILTAATSTAWPYAMALSESNSKVMARQNTMVGELTRNSNLHVLGMVDADQLSDEGSFFRTLESVSEGDKTASSVHDKLMEQYVDMVSKAINGHLLVAKTMVIPEIKDFAEEVTDRLAKAPVQLAEDTVRLLVRDVPEFLASSDIADELERYEGVTNTDRPVSVLSMDASVDNEPYLEEMLTGDKSTDEMIRQWVSSFDTLDILCDVWTDFFKPGTPLPNRYKSEGNLDAFSRMERMAVLFLFCLGLLKKDPPPDMPVTITQYKSGISFLRDYAGVTLYNMLKILGRYNKTGIMVVSKNTDDNTVAVYGPTYRTWLQKGGTVEAILGYFISDSSSSTVSAISDKQKDYENAWNSYRAIYNARMNSSAFTRFKDVLILEFEKAMNDPTEAERKYAASVSDYRNRAESVFYQELGLLKPEDMNDIYNTALKLIGKAKFYFTSAYDIICSAEAAKKANPKLEPREMFLIATIEYVGKYLSDQLVITNG